MSENPIAPWGPLGTPSKEDIQNWWSLPAGRFPQIVKDAVTRERKETRLKEKYKLYKVRGIKVVRTSYVSTNIEQVSAKDYKHALKIAQEQGIKFQFSDTPREDKDERITHEIIWEN